MSEIAQHAELSLAIYLVEHQASIGYDRTIEIGVSKACCDRCYEWVEHFNRYFDVFLGYPTRVKD